MTKANGGVSGHIGIAIVWMVPSALIFYSAGPQAARWFYFGGVAFMVTVQLLNSTFNTGEHDGQ